MPGGELTGSTGQTILGDKMGMLELQNALQLVKQNQDQADFEGPKQEELIRLAESTLALRFPPTYRKFLEELGCGDAAGFEVYGLINENFANSSVPNGIWLTLKHRRSSDLPASFVVIADTGDGGYYAIDTAQRDEDEESPIVVWWPGLSKATSPIEKVSNDFGTFFLDRLSQALAK
jgi:hypothetical protein